MNIDCKNILKFMMFIMKQISLHFLLLKFIRFVLNLDWSFFFNSIASPEINTSISSLNKSLHHLFSYSESVDFKSALGSLCNHFTRSLLTSQEKTSLTRQPGDTPFERKHYYLQHYEQLWLVLKNSFYPFLAWLTEKNLFSPCLQVKRRLPSGCGNKEEGVYAEQVPSFSNTFLKISNPISSLK